MSGINYDAVRNALVSEVLDSLDEDDTASICSEELTAEELTAEEVIKMLKARVIDMFAERLYNKATALKSIESDDYGMLHYEDIYKIADEMKAE